jgi:hypothetical protein
MHHMELPSGQYACQWCARHFDRPCPNGRKPVYCARTCRQRAYEARRRCALVANYPRPTLHTSNAPARYEAGKNRKLLHALRPAGYAAPNGFRPALCGAWAHPIRPDYTRASRTDTTCRTCDGIAARHPPARVIDPPTDLAIITALAGSARPHVPDLPPPVQTLISYCWPSEGLQPSARNLA